MDTDHLVAQSRARFAHEAARRVLREKYQAKMVFAHSGGMWRAGPELLSLLAVCPGDEVVILDLYENPVRVKIHDLKHAVQQRWQEQMTAWEQELEEINRKR